MSSDENYTDSMLEIQQHDLKSRKERCIDRIKHNSGMTYSCERPLNVAFIGYYGAGKSSLINTIGTSFRGYWEEHAMCGSYGGHGKPLTVNVESFPMCCQGNNSDYQDWNLPTLTDVAGFPDECSDKWEELFRILFYGRLKAGEALVEAEEYANSHGVEGLRRRYTARSDGQKVDRVVFVQAVDTPIKENLIKCMLRAAQPSRRKSDKGDRAIPIYGILTKADRVDNREVELSTATIEEDFLACLGLTGNNSRFLMCKNYCVDVNPGQDYIEQADPALDLPVLNWFAQVSSRTLKVQHDDDKFPAGKTTPQQVETDTEPVRQTAVGNIFNFTKGDRPGFQLTPDINIPPQYLVMAFEVFFIAILIMGLSSTSSDDLQLNADCVRLLDQKTIREKFPMLAQSCENRFSGRGVVLDFILRLMYLLVLGAVSDCRTETESENSMKVLRSNDYMKCKAMNSDTERHVIPRQPPWLFYSTFHRTDILSPHPTDEATQISHIVSMYDGKKQ